MQKVEIAQRRHERVWIVNRDRTAVGILNRELIRENRDASIDVRLEQSRGIHPAHCARRVARDQQIDARSARAQRADHEAVALEMRAEDRMRIVMLQRQQAIEVGVRRARLDGFSFHFLYGV